MLGDFDDATYSADGVTSRFFRQGTDFYINTQGPDGANHDYKVLYTFGYQPLQQYLVAFPAGRMQVPRVSWDVKKKKWFHQYAGEKIHSSDWLHWSRDAQNWNTMCSSCHSTNVKKNYDIEKDSYHTTFSSVNVGCESCHGPGAQHIAFVESDVYRNGSKIPGTYLRTISQLNTCAPCHARKGDLSSEFIESGDLLDNYLPAIPTTEHFHADGQIKDEDFIHSSFLQSKMFHEGVKCSDCHNSHTGKLRYTGNRLCLQCHDNSYNKPSHHFHETDSGGAQCKSCHMPGETYMGNDFRRDHSMRVPRPDLSAKYGTPNACSSCHPGKSAQWAADIIVKNFGDKRAYHFSEDLIPGSQLDEQSEKHLLKLLKDLKTPSIIRATAASYLGSIVTPQGAASLNKSMSDPDALTRYHTLRSLSNFPPHVWIETAAPLLLDSVRAVRIAAADLFLTVHAERLPERYRTAFNTAREELRRYLHYQADFAEGNVMIGDHYLKVNDYHNAEKYYLRALRKDSLLNYARLNLSVAYSAIGNQKEALRTLEAAAVVSPDNDRVFYNLALLNIEMKDTSRAVINFEKGLTLHSRNPRLYYNYGILLFHRKNVRKAEAVLTKGLALNPGDEDLNYAMAFVCIQSNQKDKARSYVQKLLEINPSNAAYQNLLR